MKVQKDFYEEVRDAFIIDENDPDLWRIVEYDSKKGCRIIDIDSESGGILREFKFGIKVIDLDEM